MQTTDLSGGTKTRCWSTIFATLFSVTVALVPAARAEDEHAERIVQHTPKVETKDVGDIPGHITGVAESIDFTGTEWKK